MSFFEITSSSSMPLPRRLAIALIGLYQRTLSLDHGPLRRLYPDGICMHTETCSEFGKRMMAEQGIWKGSWLTLRRIMRCR